MPPHRNPRRDRPRPWPRWRIEWKRCASRNGRRGRRSGFACSKTRGRRARRNLEAEYDGYGDSGNVEAITADPAIPEVDAIPGLADFLWSIAYAEHPGFENNEGGGGTVSWDLVADRIDLDHYDNVVERVHAQSEDL